MSINRVGVLTILVLLTLTINIHAQTSSVTGTVTPDGQFQLQNQKRDQLSTAQVSTMESRKGKSRITEGDDAVRESSTAPRAGRRKRTSHS